MRDRIKTVVVVSDFGYVEGGAAKVALDSVRLLHSNGYNVILFCGSARVDPEIEALGIRIERLGMPQLLENPSKRRAMIDGLWNRVTVRRLRELLAELNPQESVVHVHGWTKILSPSVFSVLRKSSFGTVMTAHDYFLACPNGAFYDYIHKRLCHYHGGSLRCLFCNCDVRNYIQKVWRWLRQQFVAYQLKRFPQLTVLTISSLNDRILRAEMGGRNVFFRVNNPVKISSEGVKSIEDKTDFFFVGRASPEKGLDLFVRAVTECDVHGVVIGDGPVLAETRGRYPNVEYLGWLDPKDVRRIVQSRAAVLVFPSRLHEGAPLTPLEMLAETIPCIVSDSTAAVEYIEEGKTGLLFKSGDVVDLERKIEVLRDPVVRSRYSENIRKTFKIDGWSEELHLQSLKRVYANLLKS